MARDATAIAEKLPPGVNVFVEAASKPHVPRHSNSVDIDEAGVGSGRDAVRNPDDPRHVDGVEGDEAVVASGRTADPGSTTADGAAAATATGADPDYLTMPRPPMPPPPPPGYWPLRGRVEQVDSIKTRVESACGFSACTYNITHCFQTLLSISTCATTARGQRPRILRRPHRRHRRRRLHRCRQRRR